MRKTTATKRKPAVRTTVVTKTPVKPRVIPPKVKVAPAAPAKAPEVAVEAPKPAPAPRTTPAESKAARLAQAVENALEVSQKLSAGAPVWAQAMVCPKCSGIMAMMKRRLDTSDHGENIGYHCPNCFLWMQVTEAVHFNLVPTLDQSRIGWQGLDRAEAPTKAAVAVQAVKAFVTVPAKPASPVQSNVVWKVLWEHFWDSIMDGKDLTPADLIAYAAKAKGDTPRLRELVKTLPVWMAKHTGYVVKLKEGKYTVAGKTAGSLDLAPFSDANYRKVHQFA